MEQNRNTEEMERQQPFACWLDQVEKIGKVKKKKLLTLFGTPEEIFLASKEALECELTQEQISTLLASKKRDIYKEYEDMKEKGILFYPFYHKEFPKRLLQIPDSPFGIYVKGKLPADEGPSVAIVGARSCSEYGRFVAETFSARLAEEGVQIISGMARGIDGIAQRAAIEAGGETYGVLGCGADICYPASHRQLYEDICGSGGIVSTYPPGTPPLSSYFPPRNRIISGLADAVLVVEARKKSGTLITVDMALEQGREVYVVPGRITDRLSDGCNGLLLQGAGIALTPAQFLEELSKSVLKDRGEDVGCVLQQDTLRLTKEEKELLSLLDFYPISLDQIHMMMQTKKNLSKMTLPQTMEMLLKLTMDGYVKQEGGYYGLQKPGSDY